MSQALGVRADVDAVGRSFTQLTKASWSAMIPYKMAPNWALPEIAKMATGNHCMTGWVCVCVYMCVDLGMQHHTSYKPVMQVETPVQVWTTRT